MEVTKILYNLAYRPPFSCNVPVNNSLVASVVNGTDIQLIGSTCEIEVVRNNTNSSGHDVLITLPCHYGYNYDIHQDTVITEVGHVFIPQRMLLAVTERLENQFLLSFRLLSS